MSEVSQSEWSRVSALLLLGAAILYKCSFSYIIMAKAGFDSAWSIVILPRPKYYLTEEEQQRHNVVYHTYKAAKDGGDQNVYFIGVRKLMELAEYTLRLFSISL